MNNDNSGIVPAVALVMLALVSLAGCSESGDSSSVSGVSEESQAVTAVAPASQLPESNRGTVISNQTAGGYSYLEVDIGGEAFWLATSITASKPGDRIAWKDYAVMRNFNSTSLQRQFPQILFVDRVVSESEMADKTHRGTVLESMNSAGYSYIRVEEDGVNRWLAAPETEIKVGQSIRWSGGSAMRNFSSRSLDRVFDEIYFVRAVQGS